MMESDKMELNAFKAEIENIEKIAKDHEELVSEEFDAVHPDDLMETESEDDGSDSDRDDEDSDEELDETESEDSEADEADEANANIAEDSDDGLCDADDDDDAADEAEETDAADDGDEADETETGASAITGTEDAFNPDETTSRRKRRKGAAISQIRRIQAKTDYLIPFMPFNRLVREIASDYKTDLRFTKNAILALQTAAESKMIGLFSTAQLMAIHAGRQGIEPRDMTLALRAMDPDCGGI